MSTIKPLGNKVLIERQKAEQSKGGILLPDSAQEKPRMGTVMAVGPGKIDDQGTIEPLAVKVGDNVLFSSYSGTEVRTDTEDKDLLIMGEDDILGILG